MQKLMILGASELQLPAIEKAKKMGIFTIAIDFNANALGMGLADKSYVISTLDKEAVYKVAKEECINGIMTIASDYPMRTVAYICEKMNLPGIDICTSIRATDKGKMRTVLEDNHIPVPKFFIAKNFSDYLAAIHSFDGKKVVKPSDNSGSRGICLLDREEDIETAYQYSLDNSRNGQIIVEEYMNGQEVSVESVTVDGNTTIIAITDKITSGPPHFVELGHSQPSILPSKIIKEIEDITKKSISALGIKFGTSHTEVMVMGDNVKIIEVGARLGGDYINTHLTRLSTGIDIVELAICIALGIKIAIPTKTNRAALIHFIKGDTGTLEEIDGIEEIAKCKYLYEIKLYKEKGDHIKSVESSLDRIGHYILSGDNIFELREINEEFKRNINVRIRRKK